MPHRVAPRAPRRLLGAVMLGLALTLLAANAVNGWWPRRSASAPAAPQPASPIPPAPAAPTALAADTGPAPTAPEPPVPAAATSTGGEPLNRDVWTVPARYQGHIIRGRVRHFPDKLLALTFDDGPHPEMTPFILDLLDRYGMKATFFLVGKQAAMYPELVRMIAQRGHQLGSHSQTHTDLRRLDQRGVEQELVKSRAVIRQACGQTVTLFRPPGGNYDDEVRAAVAATGYTTVFWTENIGNYSGDDGQAIARAMCHKLSNGGIVLLHNGYDETQIVLPHLLPLLSATGLRVATVTELTGAG
mgnify:CR=1 FL=1